MPLGISWSRLGLGVAACGQARSRPGQAGHPLGRGLAEGAPRRGAARSGPGPAPAGNRAPRGETPVDAADTSVDGAWSRATWPRFAGGTGTRAARSSWVSHPGHGAQVAPDFRGGSSPGESTSS
jgi:hypothetical protein